MHCGKTFANSSIYVYSVQRGIHVEVIRIRFVIAFLTVFVIAFILITFLHYLFFGLFVYLFVCLFVCLLVCLFVCFFAFDNDTKASNLTHTCESHIDKLESVA